MGGEATPGLGAPEEEELLGRVSRDLARCRPEAAALLPLPAPTMPTVCINTCRATGTPMHRSSGASRPPQYGMTIQDLLPSSQVYSQRYFNAYYADIRHTHTQHRAP